MVEGLAQPQVLYVGRFRLPDRNAAAQRVLANAKGLREAGFDVVLAEIGDINSRGGPIERLSDYEGFVCYRLPMKESGRLDHPQLAIRQVVELIEVLPSVRAVIAYNYPAIPLARLHRVCRNRGIRCAADVTEWYGSGHLSSGVSKVLKRLDTGLRMRVIQRRLDALVVISKYLEDYYRGGTRADIIRLPPLVDVQDSKWARGKSAPNRAEMTLVWAGSFNAEKERLDLTVDAVREAAERVALRLDVVGMSSQEFADRYPDVSLPEAGVVTFHGRVAHQEALDRVARADYSIIVRDQSRVTDAGFPTKFVESITLGTPVLATEHPDLSDILADGRNGSIVPLDDVVSGLIAVHGRTLPTDRELFDYRNYGEEFDRLARVLEGRQ